MNAVFDGRRRSGKTTLAFRKAIDDGGGIIVFDPKREFRGWPFTVNSVEGVIAAVNKKAVVIVYQPTNDTDEEFTLLGEWVIRQHEMALQNQWDVKGLHFTLLYDEAHNSQGPQFANPKLLQILSQNRPEILNVYQTFQSPKDMYNRLKSRVSDWYIFSTNLISDLQYLEKEIGVTPEGIEQIRNLNDHEYVHFYFDGGTPKANLVTDSKSWYIDLNYTEESEKLMEREQREDKETKKPRYPLQAESDRDIFDAYEMINKRKGGKDSGHRGRKSDREQNEGGGGERGGKGGKVFKIGDWQKEKSA